MLYRKHGATWEAFLEAWDNDEVVGQVVTEALWKVAKRKNSQQTGQKATNFVRWAIFSRAKLFSQGQACSVLENCFPSDVCLLADPLCLILAVFKI